MRPIVHLALIFGLTACAAPRVLVTRPPIPVEPHVSLAADVVLPSDRPAAGVPTILIQTRYWRSFRMRGGGPRIPQGPREAIVARLVRAGFAVVVVDVRGTGASDGEWRWPWSPEEVRDMRTVIDWIVAQPWSNGAVGATGVSYEGTTALLSASHAHPALKAVLARQVEWELADETLAPGGVRNSLFADTWGDAVDALDHGRYPRMFPRIGKLFITGVARRDDDRKGVAQRSRESKRPPSDIARRARGVRLGDDRFGADAPPVDSIGPAGHAAALATTGAVVAIWGSWWDGATADAVFRAQAAMPIAQAVIGGWTHEGDANASPWRRASSSEPTVDLDSIVAFFVRTVRDTPVRPDSAQRVRWYVGGAEQWRSAARWPGTTGRSWRLSSAPSATAADTLHVWRATKPASTGSRSRWTTGLARPVDAPDRARAPGLRSFLLPPLEQPLSVFGAGDFSCPMSADVPDAALHVYVEAVDERGHVRLLTEGMTRVRRPAGPVVTPRESLRDVSVRIRPVAFTLAAGARVRLSLASEDTPTFERVPPAGAVTWTFDPTRCALTLPVTGGA